MKSIITGLLLLSICLNIQCQKKEVKIIATKLTEQVYMLKGQGGNIGLFIGDDAVFMIDDQFAPLTPKILAAIKKITDEPVSYLINTHWHGDHTGGNENMEKEGALIVAHENVRKRMSVDQIIRGRTKKAAPKTALPVITFSKDMMMHINNDAVFITHTHNSHTDGDAFVYFTNNNVLHMGDAYFQGKFPYIDLDSGGSIKGYISGIEKAILLTNDETQIIPGHGNISKRADLKKYLLMLRTITKNITTEIEKGKNLEEILTNESISKGFESYSGWINTASIKTTIFKSLSK